MKKTYKLLTILITTLLLVSFSSVVKAEIDDLHYTGGATEYEQCNGTSVYSTSAPTLSDIAACRADVARVKNEGKSKPIPNQGLFGQPGYLDPSKFSILSWISLIINFVIIGVILYWIYLIIRGAALIIGSLGNPAKILEGFNQIRLVIVSIIAMFVFLLVLIIVGNFFGIGSIWEWPKSFSQCKNYDNKFYFTVRLENPGQDIQCN